MTAATPDHAATPEEPSDAASAEAAGADDGLLSRLRVIEDQPLASRAEALTHVHDELRARLEAGDTPRPHA